MRITGFFLPWLVRPPSRAVFSDFPYLLYSANFARCLISTLFKVSHILEHTGGFGTTRFFQSSVQPFRGYFACLRSSEISSFSRTPTSFLTSHSWLFTVLRSGEVAHTLFAPPLHHVACCELVDAVSSPGTWYLFTRWSLIPFSIVSF